MVVYRITNKINGKVYIGKTTLSAAQRWRHHCKAARAGSPVYLYRAIRKYGADSFALEPLYTAKTEKELNAMETFFIIMHQSHLRENGYNGTLGGTGGPQTEEIRRKMRGAWTPERKLEWSDRRRGVKLSAETCKAIGDSKRGVKNPWFGKKRPDVIAAMHRGLREKPISVETRERMSQAAKARGSNTTGLKWMHKEDQRKRVRTQDMNLYLDQGWQPGSNVHQALSAETRHKIGDIWRGKKFSEEHRRKIGQARTGHAVSESTRSRISQAWTPERRAALSARTEEMNRKKAATNGK